LWTDTIVLLFDGCIEMMKSSSRQKMLVAADPSIKCSFIQIAYLLPSTAQFSRGRLLISADGPLTW